MKSYIEKKEKDSNYVQEAFFTDAGIFDISIILNVSQKFHKSD